MKLRLGTAAMLCALALPAHGHAAPQTDAEFAEALYGCWTRVSWSAEVEAQRKNPDFMISGQMCLEGGKTGRIDFSNCAGIGLDCWTNEAQYEIRDGMLWRDHGDNTSGGRVDKCDMALEGGRWLTLSNCQWVDADPGVEPIEDIVYERLIEL